MTTEILQNKPKFGDVVLVPFPFTDLSSHKVRPALVVSGFKENVSVLLITSQNKSGLYCISVDSNQENGLKYNSTVITSNITTLDKKMILGKFGVLNEVEIESVKVSLRAYLNL